MQKAGQEFAAVGTARRKDPKGGVSGEYGSIIRGVYADGVAGVPGGMHDPAFPVSHANGFPSADPLFTLAQIRVGVNTWLVALDDPVQPSNMVEMVMGYDHLVHRLFSYSGGDGIDLFDDRSVGPNIDQGIHILDPVPFSENKV